MIGDEGIPIFRGRNTSDDCIIDVYFMRLEVLTDLYAWGSDKIWL